MSDFASSLDVDGDNNTSLYGEDVSTPKLSDHEMSQHANVVGEDVENVSTMMYRYRGQKCRFFFVAGRRW
jgi:hypothetical protein